MAFCRGPIFTEAEFRKLSNAPPEQLAAELDAILTAYGYEHFYNPDLIMRAAVPVAEHLLGLEWQLLKSPSSEDDGRPRT